MTIETNVMIEAAMTRDELASNESVIERGKQTFVEVGLALMAIRDGRGYRFEYGTFEDYCQRRWQFSRIQAHRLIDAAGITRNLLPIGNRLPATESQARPLAALEPEQQREAWQRAVETAPEGKVTAAHVQSVVDAIAPKPHVAHNSGENEWYTPMAYTEAAQLVMGGIDLDPASTAIANKTVGAKRFYSKQDDGLSKDWRGRVWMNPPYAGELIGLFAEKLAASVETEEVTQAIVLVNNATETAWFARLIGVASAVVFTKGRVKFLDPEGNPGAPLQGQAVIYCGDQAETFLAHFDKFGWGARL